MSVSRKIRRKSNVTHRFVNGPFAESNSMILVRLNRRNKRVCAWLMIVRVVDKEDKPFGYPTVRSCIFTTFISFWTVRSTDNKKFSFQGMIFSLFTKIVWNLHLYCLYVQFSLCSTVGCSNVILSNWQLKIVTTREKNFEHANCSIRFLCGKCLVFKCHVFICLITKKRTISPKNHIR